ncbi:ATP-binding protein [Desulfurobacterium atlanticum]|uniref:AAA+ ATPase domain-containing protein n=1 Tax=Desulfurobacterium atlanticum TaxID=240169 RepID=A0A238YRX0_9BACT|nr:ATP-binding protein [Desulfurobacterium atlanticum]SNR73897.1 hypothetical protein SAMN06265340_104149 [Desulfurobacterium atlanticum]
MRKELLKEIIISFQRKELPDIIQRDLQIPINTGKIVTLIGVRRSGKTYFLYQTIKELRKTVEMENIVYINFDDERLEIKGKDLGIIVESYRELYPDKNLSDVYFFFDEIQNVEGWEKFIKRLYETETKNIFITGSSSKLLSKEIATALRGRTISYEIYPLSFKEFLKFRKLKISPVDIYDTNLKAKVKKLFEEYLQWGGFPEISFIENEEIKLKVLQEYFDVMLYRDLVERYNFTNIPVVKYLLKRAIENVSSPFSVNNIYNELKSAGYKVSKDTLYNILDAAENIYLVRLLEKYSRSVLKRSLSLKKLYIIDNGLITANSFFKDTGKLLENITFKELLLRYKQIFYFKMKKECDFIGFSDETPDIYQVSYTVKNAKTFERETESILEACKFFRKKEAFILTFDDELEIEKEKVKIHIIPCWKFFIFH